MYICIRLSFSKGSFLKIIRTTHPSNLVIKTAIRPRTSRNGGRGGGEALVKNKWKLARGFLAHLISFIEFPHYFLIVRFARPNLTLLELKRTGLST